MLIFARRSPSSTSKSTKLITTGTTSGDLVTEEATLRGRRLLGKGERRDNVLIFFVSIVVFFKSSLQLRPRPPPPTSKTKKTGATYPLPEGYAAYVLPKDQKHRIKERETAPEASTSEAEATKEEEEEEELLGLGPPTCWKAGAASSASPSPPSSVLTYWKLDEHPTPQDGQRRALDWVGTARAVAARVSREEVDSAMMKE